MEEYEHDYRGFWVLIGLTHEETEEFERLDQQIDTLRAAEQMLYEAGNSPMTADVKRWAELSDKHYAMMTVTRKSRKR